MLVKGFFVSLVSFEPPLPQGECASCGAPAERQVRVARNLMAPYCARCASRTRFYRRFTLMTLAIVALGLLIVVLPVYAKSVPLWVAFVLPPLIIGGVLLPLGIRRETRRPSGGATTQQDAVRLLRPSPPWFFCSSRRFMERLVTAHGGQATPGVQRQWDVAWSAICAGGGILGVTWFFLLISNDGTIMVDNGSRAPAVVFVDGRVVTTVQAGAHEKLHMRAGQHTLAWSTSYKPEHERVVQIEGTHHYLYNPGATTCYWRSIGVYEKRGPANATSHDELKDDGPLAIGELYDLRRVDRWFEPNPTEVSMSSGQTYTTDYAIVRDDQCTELLRAGCPKAVIDELLRCESGASTHAGVNACMSNAQAACGTTDAL